MTILEAPDDFLFLGQAELIMWRKAEELAAEELAAAVWLHVAVK